jgi:diguanylate cyclase (GGDEF)-like protein
MAGGLLSLGDKTSVSLFRSFRRYSAVAALAALAVVFACGTSTAVFRRLTANEEHTRSAAIASNSLQGALVAVIDEQTGVRGYVTSSAPEFLEPYTSGVQAYQAYRRTPPRLLGNRSVEMLIEHFKQSADALQAVYRRQLALITGGARNAARVNLPAQDAAFEAVRADEEKAAQRVATLLAANRRETDDWYWTANLIMNGMGLVLVGGGVAASLFAALARDNARLARRDALTALPNRRAFDEALEQQLEGRTPGDRLAVLYADLDGFKEINDRLGHHAGDRLLSACGERFRRAVRPEDFVGRIGGDEFVAILNPVASREEAEKVVARIIHSIEEPFVVGGSSVQLSTSIGIGLVPDDAKDGHDVVRIADERMYHLKRLRRAQEAVHTILP